MKAIVIAQPGGPEVLTYQDVPNPVPGPEDLLIRVHATALNRADILQRMGGYPQPGPKPAHDIPGLEFAGEVIRIGDRVQGFAVGERVMGLLPGAGYAEQVITHQRLAMKVPESLSWHEAGATPEVYITAHDALLQCGLVAGESVLIHAAGSGVGVAAIQIAKMMGASVVIGTAGSAEKLAQAKALGMDFGANYKTQDFAEVALEATGGRGVDVVLDVIGADYLEKNFRALALKGRMVIVGLMGGGAPRPTSACSCRSGSRCAAPPSAPVRWRRRATPRGRSKRASCRTSPAAASRWWLTASSHWPRLRRHRNT